MTITNKFVATLALCMMSAVSVAEGKIAILSPSGAVFATAAAKAKFEKLEKSADFMATKAKLDGISADAKALNTSAQKEGSTWSDEKKTEAERKLQGLTQDFQFNAKKLQTAQQELKQKIMEEMNASLGEAIKKVVEAEKIGLVLDSQVAIHATTEYDITPKVTELLNKAK